MDNFGLYEVLENTFDSKIKISRKNKSPISQSNSSYIRHNYKDLYKEKIIPVDLEVRKQFTKDIAEYFSANTDLIYSFISDMLEKNSITSKKQAPDRLIVLNYKKNTVREVDLKRFKSNISNNIRTTDTGLVIGNIRIAFSWQNGVGLNNPTIRIFLED
jgi:hypothetical protein